MSAGKGSVRIGYLSEHQSEPVGGHREYPGFIRLSLNGMARYQIRRCVWRKS